MSTELYILFYLPAILCILRKAKRAVAHDASTATGEVELISCLGRRSYSIGMTGAVRLLIMYSKPYYSANTVSICLLVNDVCFQQIIN